MHVVPFRGDEITQRDLLRIIDLRSKSREAYEELVQASRQLLQALEDGAMVQDGPLKAFVEAIEVGDRRQHRVILDGHPIVED